MTTDPSMPAGLPAGVTLRPFDIDRDVPAAVAILNASEVAAGAEWRSGEDELRHDWTSTPGFVPARDARIAEVDGVPVGFVSLDWRERAGGLVTHRIDVTVAPAARRRGIGSALVAWAEARAEASLTDGTGGPPDRTHRLGGWGDDAIPGFRGLAAARGYRALRYFFLMRRDLAQPIPDAPMPAGLELRPVAPAQLRAIWDADVEAFADHWEAPARTEEDMRAMFEQPATDPSIWQVAWDGDEVAGSVLNWIVPDENAKLGIQRGWLEHVSVRRPWRGRGLGSALIAASLRVLRDRGMTEAALGVDADSPTGAVGLYERMGFRTFRTNLVVGRPLPLDPNEAAAR